MSAINFKEIPEAHLGGGLQDTFELFTRDFLSHLGYTIDENPARGADGGKDLVVIERRSGVGGITTVRWLVSCKHKAHSGSSVTPIDEANVRDRVDANHCDGFIGFYSTLPSEGLSRMVRGLSINAGTQIFDREMIETYLLKSPEGLHLAKRYFPTSAGKWIGEHSGPASVFPTHSTLSCQNCGKDLLVPQPTGIIVFWYKRDFEAGKYHVERFYWCCKGHCDQTLTRSIRGTEFSNSWEDIPDIAIPLIFARWVMTPLNQLYRGSTYSLDAFEKLKELLLSIYPYVARNSTEAEKARLKMLYSVPSFLGGLGD